MYNCIQYERCSVQCAVAAVAMKHSTVPARSRNACGEMHRSGRASIAPAINSISPSSRRCLFDLFNDKHNSATDLTSDEPLGGSGPWFPRRDGAIRGSRWLHCWSPARGASASRDVRHPCVASAQQRWTKLSALLMAHACQWRCAPCWV